jgi:hypothetical protein
MIVINLRQNHVSCILCTHLFSSLTVAYIPCYLVLCNVSQLENVEYFNYLGSMITDDTRYTREIKSRITIEKAAFNKKKTFHEQTGLKFKEETSKLLHLEHSFLWC